MSGRIFGWLLICEPPQQSHTELAEILQASKGSISTMTRLLLQLQLIERIRLPGDRRDFFQIRSGVWRETCNYFLRQVTAFREVAQHGLEMMRDAAPPQKERLQEMHDIHAFWERELPLLNARWEAERS
ncbi:GbsR/MarR family transcriptional regulator [Leptolyngbya ohadii]|uniref:GbsR/MarR family transcriptional regulator n=1 Tax=Leptolyngbya ohadii TaxID=1962290 RepID=UPI000B59DA54|nr:MarR family transcriptional regulator [Leptolyngbya ohadii]